MSTQRRFDVVTTLFGRQRCYDVKTTSCAYRDIWKGLLNLTFQYKYFSKKTSRQTHIVSKYIQKKQLLLFHENSLVKPRPDIKKHNVNITKTQISQTMVETKTNCICVAIYLLLNVCFHKHKGWNLHRKQFWRTQCLISISIFEKGCNLLNK